MSDRYMHGHGRTVCSCGAVIVSCRCIACAQNVRVVERGCHQCRHEDGNYTPIVHTETTTPPEAGIQVSVLHIDERTRRALTVDADSLPPRPRRITFEEQLERLEKTISDAEASIRRPKPPVPRSVGVVYTNQTPGLSMWQRILRFLGRGQGRGR